MVGFFCLLATSFVANCSAPIPKTTKPVLYHPTTLGTKWVYQSGDFERIEEITAVEEKDGIAYVTIGSAILGGMVKNDTILAVSSKGIEIVATKFCDFDSPINILKPPHTNGQKWKATISIQGQTLWTTNMKSYGPEIISVPAGKFEAIRVEASFICNGQTQKSTDWYAPNVGLIKHIVEDSANIEYLKKFTLGNNCTFSERDHSAPREGSWCRLPGVVNSDRLIEVVQNRPLLLLES